MGAHLGVKEIVPRRAAVFAHAVMELGPGSSPRDAGWSPLDLILGRGGGLPGRAKWMWQDRHDPGLSFCFHRPSRNPSMHLEAEPDLYVQARLVLHVEEAGGLPAVRAYAQVPPRLQRGQARYGTGLQSPRGFPSWAPLWCHRNQCICPAWEHAG